MLLKDLVKKVAEKNDIKTLQVWVFNESGVVTEKEFADELVETHGDTEVIDQAYVARRNVLYVRFN